MADGLNSTSVARRHLLGGMAVAALPAVPVIAMTKSGDLLSAFRRWFTVETEFLKMETRPEWSDADCIRACEGQDALIRHIAGVPADSFDGLAVKVALLLHVQNSPEFHGDPVIRAENFQGDFQEDVLQRSLLADVQARFPELRA